jgi:hypothetical protein
MGGACARPTPEQEIRNELPHYPCALAISQLQKILLGLLFAHLRFPDVLVTFAVASDSGKILFSRTTPRIAKTTVTSLVFSSVDPFHLEVSPMMLLNVARVAKCLEVLDAKTAFDLRVPTVRHVPSVPRDFLPAIRTGEFISREDL